MDGLAYTSLSALRSAMARQAATAHNLANANTPGFRADMSAVQTVWIQSQGLPVRAQSADGIVSADMHGGALTQTGRSLDVALSGDALLGVQAENGEEAYTRRGDLQVADSGLLTTGDGHPVLGDSGPITIPAHDSIRIDQDGSIWIVPPGSDPANPQQVDRIKVVSTTGSHVVKGVDGLFRVPNGGALPADPQARVSSQNLEGSNVDVTQSLVDMIDASRSYDMQLRLVSSAKDMDTSATDLMRIPD